MLQPVHDCKKFYSGTKWVPAELVIGGDHLFVRRLIGVSISPLVCSFYNMGVWDKVAAAWVKPDVRRTLEGEAVETGLTLENGGCVGDTYVVAERCRMEPPSLAPCAHPKSICHAYLLAVLLLPSPSKKRGRPKSCLPYHGLSRQCFPGTGE